jgi:hypothetical protein
MERRADTSAKEIVRNCEETVRSCAFILTHAEHKIVTVHPHSHPLHSQQRR